MKLPDLTFSSDFIGPNLPRECALSTSGTGAAGAFVEQAGGGYQLSSGTSNGAYSILRVGGAVFDPSRDIELEVHASVDALADANSIVSIGLANHLFALDDCALFRFKKGVNSDLWQCVTKDENSETTSNTGVAGAAGGAIFRIRATDSAVQFTIGGVEMYEHETNLPDEPMYVYLAAYQAGNPGTSFDVQVHDLAVRQKRVY